MFSLSKSYAEFWYSESEWALLIFGCVLLVALYGETRGDKEPLGTSCSRKYLRMFEDGEIQSRSLGRVSFFKKYWHSFALFVVIGVLGELFAEAGIFVFGRELQVISDRENFVLSGRASASEDRAKQLNIRLNETKTELANAETRLIEVRNENLPMDIGDEFSLGNALQGLTGIQVELRSVIDVRAEHTADNLASAFDLGGWRVINRSEIHDFGYDGIIIEGHNDVPSQKAAQFLLKLLTERGVPSESGDEMAIIPFTNTILVAVGHRPSATKSQLMILQAKEKAMTGQFLDNSARMVELQQKRFAPNSKELADAQAEFNDLNSKVAKFFQESRALGAQKEELDRLLKKEIWGTNASAPGSFFTGNTISGGKYLVIAPTNARIFMRDTRINPPPLQ